MTRKLRSLSLLTLCGLSACATDGVDSALRPPADPWMTEVSARIAASARAVRQAEDGSFIASIPMASASARFDRQSTTLSRHGGAALGLRLDSWGRADALTLLGDAEPALGGCVSEKERDPEGDCIRALERQHEGLTEWWVGLDTGVEQGFTIAERPAGEGEPVQIVMAIDGALDLDTDGETVRMTDGDGVDWTVTDLAAWDADGQPLPVAFEAEGDALRIVVDDAGASYPLTVDPVYSSATTLSPSWTNAGYSVAGVGDLNGDGYDDVAVGAPGTISTLTSVSGSVYFYAGTSSSVSATASATLTAPSTPGNFGYSIAGGGDIDGDGNPDVLIGAPYPTSQNGTVYVYWGQASAWPSSGSKTTLSGPSAGSEFGTSIAMIDDIDRDGFDEFAVGAPGYSSSRGQVIVYYGDSSHTQITASGNVDSITGGSSGDEFGAALAAVGDIDNDNYDDLLVGAPGYGSGAAFVFEGSRSGLSTSSSRTLSAPSGSTYFAQVVCGLGDVNGDGYDDVAVTDAGYNGNHGAVYVYRGGSSGVSTSYTRLSASSTSTRYFGVSIAGVGDLDADGYADFAIGATSSSASSGRVEIYHGDSAGGATSSADQLSGSTGAFGYSLSAAGDVNADGFDDFIVGNRATTGGTAVVYRGLSDDDRDGVATSSDCDDNDPNVGAQSRGWPDADGDGYGVGSYNDYVMVCPDDTGYASDDDDCDDADPAIHPRAAEIYANGIDESCDGREYCFLDADEDGSPQGTDGISSSDLDCDDPGESYGTGPVDCDDSDRSIHPGAAEDIADGFDADCDGMELCYADADLDGFRGESTVASADLACAEPGLATAEDAAGDCDDADAAIFPGAEEQTGDGLDGDCDGQELCYTDADGDGFRPDEVSTVASEDADCADPGEALATTPAGDCDDNTSLAFPGAEERVGDGLDGDCDGMELCYTDGDGDGYHGGASAQSADLSCSEAGLAGSGAQPGDCDDDVATVNPSVSEEPGDGIDQDCDGSDELTTEDGGRSDKGCSTVGAAPSAGLLGLFGLLALRRRR